jgi:hypothetical protein
MITTAPSRKNNRLNKRIANNTICPGCWDFLILSHSLNLLFILPPQEIKNPFLMLKQDILMVNLRGSGKPQLLQPN